MRVWFLVGTFVLFIVGSYISFTLDKEFLGSDTTGTLHSLMIEIDFSEYTNPLTAVGGFFTVVGSWIKALWSCLWWDYSFFEGTWKILKYAGWALSIGLIAQVVGLFRGTSSA